ncbi:transposase [Streptomyces sp. NPDC051985]|uniref:transposase n=1 Tax=Streptomyces sp. NPDC051985 TaxID=3155807 RepID=UPI003443C000
MALKKTYGFHPLAAWCAKTTECLAMLLRPGNAEANTVADHICVLTDALVQIPGSSITKILIRVDGAGATHGLLEHLEALNNMRRTVCYTVGWKITEDDEKAIARLPEMAWETSVHQDGSLQEGYFVAELTGLNTREGWPEGMRVIARRVRPTRRHLKKLTFEKKTDWRATASPRPTSATCGASPARATPSSWTVLHRSQAGMEDRVHTNKAIGLDNLPCVSWEVNCGWTLGEPRRRSRRMDAAAGPARHRRPGRCRAGRRVLPPLPPARLTLRPRPPPMAADRADLALGDRVHHLLAATDCTPSHHLTTSRLNRSRPGRSRSSAPWVQWNPGVDVVVEAPPAITRNKQGELAARSCTHDH